VTFRFEHPWFLAGLALAPVMVLLFWLLLRWKKSTVKKIGDEKLVRQLISGYSPKRFLLKFIFVLLAFILTAMGVGNLQYPKQVEMINRQGIDVMIALDVSRSMLAADIQPNRLERARQLVNKLIDQLQNDRIGLVLFAGRAYLQMPLTTDHGSAKIYVNTASPESVPTQGTVIGEALRMCDNTFERKEKKYKAVILISDGEDHDESAHDVAKEMAENGVILHTVGVGTTRGSQIIDPFTHEPKRDAQGNIVVSKLNETELFQLAQTGSGAYQLLNDTEAAVKKIISQINSMEQKSITDNTFVNYRTFFQWILAAALFFLVVELFIGERKMNKR
jgi:Ca-activated chloride channel homolog